MRPLKSTKYGMTLPAITVSEYQSDKIVGYHSAPLYPAFPGDYDALEMLEKLSSTKPTSTFGVSEWMTDTPTYGTHDGASAILMEYDARHASKVAATLTDLEHTFLMIPTLSGGLNCYAFLFPTLHLATFREARRVSTLIIQYVETNGLTPNSYLPTYHFKMRNDLPIHLIEGVGLINAKQTVEVGASILTKTKGYERKNPHK